MSATLYAEVEGKPVPLDQCDWVLWKPCGCLQAIAVASIPGHLIATEEQAWKQFFRAADGRRKARVAGLHVGLTTHQRWVADLMEGFGKPCPHGEAP